MVIRRGRSGRTGKHTTSPPLLGGSGKCLHFFKKCHQMVLKAKKKVLVIFMLANVFSGSFEKVPQNSFTGSTKSASKIIYLHIIKCLKIHLLAVKKVPPISFTCTSKSASKFIKWQYKKCLQFHLLALLKVPPNLITVGTFSASNFIFLHF